MENLGVNPTLADGDLLELSPMKVPCSILKSSQNDNLIMLQTPVHKDLKVSFITPKRTPAQTLLQPMKSGGGSNVIGSVLQDTTRSVLNTPKQTLSLSQNASLGLETPKIGMPSLRKGLIPRRPTVSDKTMKENMGRSSVNAQKKGDSKKENKWESLRKLDENLRWRERVEVITKLDHQEYTACARESVLHMIDKAVDISLAKEASSHLSEKLMTPASQVVAPTAAQNIDHISPILLKENQTADDGGVTTPVSTMNVTSDMSSQEFFVEENAEKSADVSGTVMSESKEDSNSGNLNILKPVCVPAKKQDSMQSIAYEREKGQRSSSVSNHMCFGGNTGRRSSVTVDSHPHSFDLANIPEDFDPFTPQRNEKVTPQPNAMNESVDGAQETSANRNVMVPANTTSFALREVDIQFGNEDFVDSTSLLEQGQLDLDYLEKKTTGAISQDLRKQSLYVKFDPLLEGIGNRNSIALLGRKSDIIDFNGRVTPVPEEAAEEAIVSPREPDLLCDSPSQIGDKNPAPDSSQVPRESAGSSGDSVGSGSPGLRGTTTTKLDSGIIEVLKYSGDDIQRVLKRKKGKWAKEKEAMLQKQQDYEKDLQNQKLFMKGYQEYFEQFLKTMSEEKDKREREIVALKKEKTRLDAQNLALSVEDGQLFQKAEKLQRILTNLKANELKRKEQVRDFREKCSASQKKIAILDAETSEALGKFSAEKNAFEVNHIGQINGLQMKIKAMEFKVKSLQATLDHKKNENKELMKICDEVVASQSR